MPSVRCSRSISQSPPAYESKLSKRRRQSSSSRSSSSSKTKYGSHQQKSYNTEKSNLHSRPSDEKKRPRRRRQTSSSRSSSSSDSEMNIQNNKLTKNDNIPSILKASTTDTMPDANKKSIAPTDINIYGKTGGAYIPPARLRLMQAQITDKSSEAYQRIAWEALKKSIHGLINKVNVSNIAQVIRQLLSENIVRGRGLLVRSLITSQSASPTFTHVFTAVVAVVNTKFPQIGELILKRLITEFRKAFRRNQKDRCLSTSRFLAHLVNQKVAHELVILELLTLLLEQTTDDSVEVSVAVLKECGAFLSRVVPKGVVGIFEHLRSILNESKCDKRISYMLEVMFQIRRDGWKDHVTVLPELDLIDEDEQITHTLALLDPVDSENSLNVFHLDPDFEANEEKYSAIRASFLGEDDDAEEDDGSSGSSDDSEDGSNDEGTGDQPHGAAAADGGIIIDQTETNLIQLRRTIYLMLQSSLSADEGAHRLLQLKIKPGEEYEVASMVLDCCAQTRSYESRYGRLAQRLCRVILFSDEQKKEAAEKNQKSGGKQSESAPSTGEPPRTYVSQFERIFGEQYAVVHRLETAKLKNVSLFFAHLLFTDSISWGVLECVALNERDTSSSGRIFLKHLFLELCSYMGLGTLQTRLRDETLAPFFTKLLPRDNPKDTRFAINFLTTIGLGGLTLDLREFLEATKRAGEKQRIAEAQLSSSSSDDSSSSNSDSSSSGSSSDEVSSSSSNSESDHKRKKKKLIKTKTMKKEQRILLKNPPPPKNVSPFETEAMVVPKVDPRPSEQSKRKHNLSPSPSLDRRNTSIKPQSRQRSSSPGSLLRNTSPIDRVRERSPLHRRTSNSPPPRSKRINEPSRRQRNKSPGISRSPGATCDLSRKPIDHHQRDRSPFTPFNDSEVARVSNQSQLRRRTSNSPPPRSKRINEPSRRQRNKSPRQVSRSPSITHDVSKKTIDRHQRDYSPPNAKSAHLKTSKENKRHRRSPSVRCVDDQSPLHLRVSNSPRTRSRYSNEPSRHQRIKSPRQVSRSPSITHDVSKKTIDRHQRDYSPPNAKSAHLKTSKENKRHRRSPSVRCVDDQSPLHLRVSNSPPTRSRYSNEPSRHQHIKCPRRVSKSPSITCNTSRRIFENRQRDRISPSPNPAKPKANREKKKHQTLPSPRPVHDQSPLQPIISHSPLPSSRCVEEPQRRQRNKSPREISNSLKPSLRKMIPCSRRSSSLTPPQSRDQRMQSPRNRQTSPTNISKESKQRHSPNSPSLKKNRRHRHDSPNLNQPQRNISPPVRQLQDASLPKQKITKRQDYTLEDSAKLRREKSPRASKQLWNRSRSPSPSQHLPSTINVVRNRSPSPPPQQRHSISSSRRSARYPHGNNNNRSPVPAR